ncbi:hypothetical protein P9112_006277 [Eukaryota sp. TZLM1-RC]
MPLADSDSDTDWNARVKILPVRPSFGLKSSSGVKQGDPLGPSLFCLAIHKTLNIIKQKYPSIKIVAYMDDISLIGSFDLLDLVAQEIAVSYENIGLHLNASKCLLFGSSAQDLVINDSIVPFTNYSSDVFFKKLEYLLR